jgi:hypothetical protein
MTSLEQVRRDARVRAHPDDVLQALETFVRRFVAFTLPAQVVAVVLWIMHAHAIAAAETTARIAIQSAEKQSGKTRLLEVIELVVPEPLPVANISPAAMFRVIADGPVTLLIDEVDAVFNPKSNGSSEDVRALLNAGYRRGAEVARVVGEGKRMAVQRFPVFAPVALAGIGALPDTVQDRSIVIRLKRRARGEEVEKLRRRLVAPEGARLRERAAAWVADRHEVLTAALPDVPDELPDRAGDIWEPLLAIADAAGGQWPARARAAAVELSCPASDTDQSQRVRLLADIRAIFGARSTERLSSADLVAALHALDESPWSESWFDARKLAAKLKPFDVRPKVVRQNSEVFRGYVRADFDDAFGRYLPQAVTTVTSVTTETSPGTGCNGVTVCNGVPGVALLDHDEVVALLERDLDAQVLR